MIVNCKTSIVSHNESFYATQLKIHIYFSEPESRDKSLYIKIQKIIMSILDSVRLMV